MEAAGFLEQARAWLAGLSWAEQAVGVMGISAIPWVELRGSIPLAIALGWNPLAAAAVAVAVNCLIIVPGYYALELFYDRWLSRLEVARRLVERIRAKGSGMVERYELLGLALFVAVPLPGTGAYSGTVLAWLLGLHRWRAMAAVALGVVGAGVAVTLLAAGAAATLRSLF